MNIHALTFLTLCWCEKALQQFRNDKACCLVAGCSADNSNVYKKDLIPCACSSGDVSTIVQVRKVWNSLH